ncbi:uncharacterized protein LOC135197034 isoform X1 [Macrobrachium nipponense]|uniref:uncharacterized protein LOC135197034 isoform X1 n=1 Tax=Macrobrachium nipponense TaxID=159736 RepID=UPI0030C83216
MNDEGRRKIQKTRSNRTEVSQPATVAVPHGTSLPSLLRVPSVAVPTQDDVELVDPRITQTMSLTSTQAQTHSQTVIQTHSPAQASTHRLLESLVQTHIQPHVQTNSVHSMPQMQPQDEVLLASHLEAPPEVHSQQPEMHAQPHIQIESQQTDAQVHLQTHLPGPAQTTIMHSLADLVQSEIDGDSAQQAAKSQDDLTASRIPVTRQQAHNSSVNLQDLQSASLDLNEIHTSNAQAKLLSAITSFADSNQMNSGAAGVQQVGNISLLQALSQQLTSAQIIDALIADRVLIASKNNQGQTTVTPVSSVCSTGLDGLPVMRIQGNYTATRAEDGTTTLVPQNRIPTGPNTFLETHLLNPQLSASQLQLDTSKLDPSQASNMSTLITSNKILNRLLDARKQHIPSHIAKAAELAHLIPNPSVRTASTTRSGEMEDGTLNMTFATSSRGSSPLTTLTRSSGTSMCTVTGALRSSSGYGDTFNKTSPTLQLENVSVPSNFPLNNSLLLSTLSSQNPLPQQRQYDESDHALLGSQSAENIEEAQLDGISHEHIRLFQALPVGQNPSISNCVVSGVNVLAVSAVEKNKKNFVPTSVSTSNLRPVSTGGLADVLSKNTNVMESHPRSQMITCSKQGLATSTDPVFHSVVTSGVVPSALNVYGSTKSGMLSQDNSLRLKNQVTDSRVSQLALVDLASRTSSSDIMLGSGAGNLLLGMPETRMSHTGDVLLSELHRSDESELSLSSSLTGAGDGLHSNTSALVSEGALGTGIVSDTGPLHGLPSPPPLQSLPSPPLPSLSLPNIASDFMVGGISSSKLSSGQGPFPALLTNLATTSELDQFLENSNMCIDINSLSESEVSLSTAPGTFVYSPEKPLNKKSSSPSSDLTFTSALKAATSKSDDDIKLHCDVSLSPKVLEGRSETKSSHMDIDVVCTSSSEHSAAITPTFSQPPTVNHVSSSRSKKTDSQLSSKPSSGSKDKRKEMFKKNELLVQQVACFKCRLCSFLSQDKGEMVNHMKQLHSEYLSDSDDSETEESSATKKLKVHLPRKEPENNPEETLLAGKDKSKASKAQDKKAVNVSDNNSENDSLFRMMIKEEVDNGRCRIFIKSEPQESTPEKGKEKSQAPQRPDPEQESDQTLDDDDTNDSSATSDSGSLKSKKNSTKSGRPVYSKSVGAAKLKKNSPNAKGSKKVVGIRCDVDGCSLRMKSESNIAYHRKCHEGGFLKCQECSEQFGMWRNLAVHLWRQHMIDMELHKCDKCNYKTYNYSKLMNVHIHDPQRRHTSLCDICGKRFKTARQLRSHKGVHMRKTNSPQLQCEKCQRLFSDKRMLRNHMESVHNKVKPFLCNYCGYSTASRSTLKMHMRQHTGEKPFACEKCSYRTADHNSLRRHRMQHSGVRPYRCPYCDYASIQATTFKVHIRDKHPCLADGIVFTCGICRFETIKKDNYLVHVAGHSRSETKKAARPATTPPVSTNNRIQPGTIISATPLPHVVNIDVESGAVTVESPQANQYVNSVTVQQDGLETQVPGQVTVAGDQYIYAAVDSSMLSRVRSTEGVVHITPDVVAIPLSMAGDSGSASAIQGLVYVTTSNQGGE